MKPTKLKLVAHAFLTMECDPNHGPVVFDLSDEEQVRSLIEEIRDAENWNDSDLTQDGEPEWTIKVHLMPPGYVETLPEFGGW